MNIDWILKKDGKTIYYLAKESRVPYSTVSDIVRGKTPIQNCSAGTVYRLAKVLGVRMEDLLADEMERPDFELFKSNVCHDLKQLGDVRFLLKTLQSAEIRRLYERGWYRECLYLLAMVDYISRLNGVPLAEEYNDLRSTELLEIVWPASILALCAASGSDEPKKQALQEAIPEFLRFNIVEGEVRNVV